MKRRNQCEICGSKTLELFFTIKKLPIRIGVSDEARNYKYLDLNYVECQNCKNIQILNLPNISDVYEINHNISVIGKIWRDHNNKFSRFVLNSLRKDSKILEIGDPSAKIASLIIDNDCINLWYIVEPNAGAVSNPKIKFIESFFDSNFNQSIKYDALVLSHVFEHLTNLGNLLPIMHGVLKDDGILIISVPNLRHILNEGSMAPAGLHFEHSYYFNKDMIEILLQNYGFRLSKYESFKDHSEFFCFTKGKIKKIDTKNLNNDNGKSKILTTFKVKKIKLNAFNKMLTNNSFDGRFIYGAHIQTQMFTCIGIKKKYITGVLDNDIFKQGKYVYGTNFKVYATHELAKYQRPLIYCDMGPYTNEITKQIISINPMAKIV